MKVESKERQSSTKVLFGVQIVDDGAGCGAWITESPGKIRCGDELQ